MIAVEVPRDEPPLAISRPVLSTSEAQDKWMAEALAAVAAHTAVLEDLIARNAPLPMVVSAATALLLELRIGTLPPQSYYEVYMKAVDALQLLTSYFSDYHRSGRCSLEHLYARVQYVSELLPRVYLLITAGAVYARSGTQPSLAIAADLLEACKGVQHPVRGLFLRHYLLTALKDCLPGDPNRSPSPAAAATDAGTPLQTAALLLENLGEMTWLWVRMEARNRQQEENDRAAAAALSALDEGAALAAATRRGMAHTQTSPAHLRRDRAQLKVLVGMGLLRLASLEGLGTQEYAGAVLPRLLETIARYREPVAQQYLVEALVQALPDDHHLLTLPALLALLPRLAVGVDVAALVGALAGRLAAYQAAVAAGRAALTDPEAEAPALAALGDTFLSFFESAPVTYEAAPSAEARVIKRCGSPPGAAPLPVAELLRALRALRVLLPPMDPAEQSAAAHRLLSLARTRLTPPPPAVLPPQAIPAAAELVSAVVASGRGDLLAVLPDVCALLPPLPPPGRRSISRGVAGRLAAQPGTVASLEEAGIVLELLAPLLLADDDGGGGGDADEAADAQLVCRALHSLSAADAAVYAKMLTGVRKTVAAARAGAAGAVAGTVVALHQRAGHALGTASLRGPEGGDPEALRGALDKALRHAGRGLLLSVGPQASAAAAAALHHCLDTAAVADRFQRAEVACELCTTALELHERGAGGGGRAAMDTLAALVGGLYGLRSPSAEAHAALAAAVVLHAGRLRRRGDQSRALALCATLYSRRRPRGGDDAESAARCAECVSRALALASAERGLARLALDADLLNLLVRLYAVGDVDAEPLNNLIADAEATEAALQAGGPASAAAAPGEKARGPRQQDLFESDEEAEEAWGGQGEASAPSALSHTSIKGLYLRTILCLRRRQAAAGGAEGGADWSAIRLP